MTFTYFNNLSPLYMSDVFKPAGQNTTATRTSLFKLTQSSWKTNHGQKSLSYVEPSISNKLPDFLKTTENVIMYTNTELKLWRTFSTKKFTIIFLFFFLRICQTLFDIFFQTCLINLSNLFDKFVELICQTCLINFSNLFDKFVKLIS